MTKTIFVKQKKAKSACHGDIARILREKYKAVFPNKKSAKQMVDAVIDEIRAQLIEHGRVCLRGIGTIQVNGLGRDPKEALKETGRSFSPDERTVLRRSLSVQTSDLMFDALNPENPKYPYHAKRPYVRRRTHNGR